MLILLALMPVGYAVAALCLLQVPMLWVLHREQTLPLRLPGLMRLGLLVGGFVLMTAVIPSCDCCRLTSQLLWLGCFVLEHILHYLYKRWRGARIIDFSEPTCCCTARRKQTLVAAYERFDRQLIVWTLLTLVVTIPLVSFAELSLGVKGIMTGLIALGALIVIVMELLQLGWIRRQVQQEHWIPVLTEETDEIIGRVPQTAPRAEQGRLPIVRLMAYSQGMIYLERGGDLVTPEQIHVDTPFRSWLYEGELPADAAQRMIDQRFCGLRRAKPRQLLRYCTEEGGQALLVYLFAVEIESPDLLHIDCRPIEGKWWCSDILAMQIEHSDFSQYLCSELPLLKQTVLLADQLRRKRQYDTCGEHEQ